MGSQGSKLKPANLFTILPFHSGLEQLKTRSFPSRSSIFVSKDMKQVDIQFLSIRTINLLFCTNALYNARTLQPRMYNTLFNIHLIRAKILAPMCFTFPPQVIQPCHQIFSSNVISKLILPSAHRAQPNCFFSLPTAALTQSITLLCRRAFNGFSRFQGAAAAILLICRLMKFLFVWYLLLY